jgi:hypothetical protein
MTERLRQRDVAAVVAPLSIGPSPCCGRAAPTCNDTGLTT